MRPMTAASSRPMPNTQKVHECTRKWFTRRLKFWPKNPVRKLSGRNTVAMMASCFMTTLSRLDTVEIWENVDPQTIEAKIWLWDPAVYVEPWYATRRYTRVENVDYRIRMNYWFCQENPNNEVIKTPDGNTAFKDLTFTHESKEEPKQ